MQENTELYSLLSTSRIGIEFFADLLKKSEHDSQRDRIFTAFEMCKHHIQAINHHLDVLDIEKQECDIKSTMMSFIEKIKNLTLDSRYEIDLACMEFLQESIQQIEDLQEHDDLPRLTITLYNAIHHDYLLTQELFQECLN